jgi:hypothetical protein
VQKVWFAGILLVVSIVPEWGAGIADSGSVRHVEGMVSQLD